MYNVSIPVALKKAVTPLLTRKLFYGAAISCAVGLGMGVWLEPPKAHYAAAATTVTLPEDPPNLWGDAASLSAAPEGQPATDATTASQTAAVSPPADVEPVKLAQADPAQVAAAGDTSQTSAPPASPTPVTYARPQPLPVPRVDSTPVRGRDWASYDARPRGGDDWEDDPGPPPPWARPPERPPSMQDRRWDFRPDVSAAPLDDPDDGG
jgi:hypothetical protein